MRTTLIGLAFASTGLVSLPAHAVTYMSSFAERIEAGDAAVFEIQLTGTPDFFTSDSPGGRRADDFAIWIDADAPFALDRAGKAHTGQLPLGNQAVLQGRTIADDGRIEVAWLTTFPPGGQSAGGWGDVQDHVPFTLSAGSLLTISVPYALLRDTDGQFWYSLMWTNYGSSVAVNDYVNGSSTPINISPVPEPSSYGLLACGLLMVACASRRGA